MSQLVFYGQKDESDHVSVSDCCQTLTSITPCQLAVVPLLEHMTVLVLPMRLSMLSVGM